MYVFLNYHDYTLIFIFIGFFVLYKSSLNITIVYKYLHLEFTVYLLCSVQVSLHLRLQLTLSFRPLNRESFFVFIVYLRAGIYFSSFFYRQGYCYFLFVPWNIVKYSHRVPYFYFVLCFDFFFSTFSPSFTIFFIALVFYLVNVFHWLGVFFCMNITKYVTRVGRRHEQAGLRCLLCRHQQVGLQCLLCRHQQAGLQCFLCRHHEVLYISVYLTLYFIYCSVSLN